MPKRQNRYLKKALRSIHSGLVRRHVSTSQLTILKDLIAVVQSIATVFALVAALYWFWLQRESEPRIRVDQTLTQHPNPADERSIFLEVDVTVTNIGKVVATPVCATVEVKELSPSNAELKFEKMQEFRLEPGETDQTYFRVLPLSRSPRLIAAATHIVLKGDESWDWRTRSVFTLATDSKNEPRSITSSTDGSHLLQRDPNPSQ